MIKLKENDVILFQGDSITDGNRGRSSDPERYEKIYRLLLDEVLEQNPDTLIVIMEPFFGDKKEEDLDKFFKEGIGAYQEKSKRIAEEYNAVFVPLQNLFDSFRGKTDIYKLLWDGVHPTTIGHELIARRWKECVKEKLENR